MREVFIDFLKIIMYGGGFFVVCASVVGLLTLLGIEKRA